jgi:Protein of unknown function (DUF1236)
MTRTRSRIVIISSAALLASTVLAAGQSLPDRKDKEGGVSGQQPGISQSQPKASPQGSEQGQRREERSGQLQQSRPTTSGQAPTEQPNRAQEKVQDNKQDKAQEKAQDNKQGETRTQGQNQPPRDREQTRPQQGQNQRGQEPNRTEGRAEQGGKANGGTSSVTLSTEQRTKVRQTVIEGRGAPKVDRVDFSISEGTVIPRTVHVVAVPEILVEIHPDWRGYRYFVYNDEIIIVEPETLRIVAIVET